jgi:hypothetical protein
VLGLAEAQQFILDRAHLLDPQRTSPCSSMRSAISRGSTSLTWLARRIRAPGTTRTPAAARTLAPGTAPRLVIEVDAVARSCGRRCPGIAASTARFWASAMRRRTMASLARSTYSTRWPRIGQLIGLETKSVAPAS